MKSNPTQNGQNCKKNLNSGLHEQSNIKCAAFFSKRLYASFFVHHSLFSFYQDARYVRSMSVSRNYVMFVNLLLRGSTLFLDVYFCTTKGMQKANLSNSGTSNTLFKIPFYHPIYDSISVHTSQIQMRKTMISKISGIIVFLNSYFTLFA